MSTTHDHDHPQDHLTEPNEYTPRTGDPTETVSLRHAYRDRFVTWLGHLNARIRDGIITEDIFLLRNEAEPEKPEEPNVYDFPTSQAKVQAFMTWLREQLQSGFLSIVGPASNKFIEDAYTMGAEHAQTLLPFETEIQFDSPAFRSSLRQLYIRNYELLRDVSNDMSSEIRDELVEGFQQGENPTEIARSITDRVDSVGKYRSTLIARTEVINAHSEGSLDHYERANVEGVSLRSELITADDDRTCKICKEIEDMGVFSISEMRNKVVSVFGKAYSIKPPVHPQCRCAILPVTSQSGAGGRIQ